MRVGEYYLVRSDFEEIDNQIYKIIAMNNGYVTKCELIYQDNSDEYQIGHIFESYGVFNGWKWPPEWRISEEEVKKFKLEGL